MNITKLINSRVHEDVLLAVELMMHMSAEEIKEVLPIHTTTGTECWHTRKRRKEIDPLMYKLHSRGVLYIASIDIYFTDPLPIKQIEDWGYKNMDNG